MHIEIIITLAVAIFGSTGFWTIVSKLMDRKSDSGKLLMGIAYDKIIYQCAGLYKTGRLQRAG